MLFSTDRKTCLFSPKLGGLAQRFDRERRDAAETVRTDIQKVVDAHAVQAFAARDDLFGRDPVLVVVLIPPRRIERTSRFVEAVGRIFNAVEAVGIVVFGGLELRRVFVVAERNVVVGTVADAGIDRAVGLIGLDELVEL